MAQSGQVSVWQHAGEQHGGRGPLLLAGKLLGFDKSLLQLRGQHGLRQLPEELLHKPSDVAGERGGQALLTGIQFGLDHQQTGCVTGKNSQGCTGNFRFFTLSAFRRTTEPDFLNRPSVLTCAISLMHASTRKLDENRRAGKRGGTTRKTYQLWPQAQVTCLGTLPQSIL